MLHAAVCTDGATERCDALFDTAFDGRVYTRVPPFPSWADLLRAAAGGGGGGMVEHEAVAADQGSSHHQPPVDCKQEGVGLGVVSAQASTDAPACCRDHHTARVLPSVPPPRSYRIGSPCGWHAVTRRLAAACVSVWLCVCVCVCVAAACVGGMAGMHGRSVGPLAPPSQCCCACTSAPRGSSDGNGTPSCLSSTSSGRQYQRLRRRWRGAPRARAVLASVRWGLPACLPACTGKISVVATPCVCVCVCSSVWCVSDLSGPRLSA